TTNAILQHAYEGLTRYNVNYEPEPSLATKWTYLTPTHVRFDLRKGVKFHDGSPSPLTTWSSPSAASSSPRARWPSM
ncbi:MAG: ABC transporter substrate-binding protein, partial [Aquabacterium sp.]